MINPSLHIILHFTNEAMYFLGTSTTLLGNGGSDEASLR